MNEWWDGLSLLLKVLYCIAFPSTLILLVQTLLSMFGFHDGGSGHDFSDTSGLDLDVDTNISGQGYHIRSVETYYRNNGYRGNKLGQR